MYFPCPERALAECRRVLRPGSRLGVTTWAEPRGRAVVATLAALDRLPALFVPRFADRAAVARALDCTGFTGRRVEATSTTLVYADAADYWATA